MASNGVSAASDGHALNLINKRLRALHKKYHRIMQMEEAQQRGKILNSEQKEALDSKAAVGGAIAELEKIKEPICLAVEKDVKDAVGNKNSLVEDIIRLFYFAIMFSTPDGGLWATSLEREWCLAFTNIFNFDEPDPLSQFDLSMICALGNLMSSRRQGWSHQNALHRCMEHARMWLNQSVQPIVPMFPMSYAQLREKLNKIMASDYFTAMPEMRFPAEVASATGSYASFQAPAHGSVLADTVQESGVAAQNEQREELVAHAGEVESYDNQSGHDEQFQQVEEAEQFSELPSQESENREDSREFEPREQQHAPRRSYRGGGRGMGGGGRRGYPNGRGGRGSSRGGSFQNGRGQYYDQPGGAYYPRNNYRGQGGRGGYNRVNNYPTAPQAGTAES